jgi:hypothetical protein
LKILTGHLLTFLEKATSLIRTISYFIFLSGIFTVISRVSIVKPKYSMTQVGPSVFSSAIARFSWRFQFIGLQN